MFRRKENTIKIILRFKLSLYLSIYLSQEAKGGEEHVQGSGRGEEEGAGDAQGSAKLFQIRHFYDCLDYFPATCISPSF